MKLKSSDENSFLGKFHLCQFSLNIRGTENRKEISLEIYQENPLKKSLFNIQQYPGQS